jgi:hypothetical protein
LVACRSTRSHVKTPSRCHVTWVTAPEDAMAGQTLQIATAKAQMKRPINPVFLSSLGSRHGLD